MAAPCAPVSGTAAPPGVVPAAAPAPEAAAPALVVPDIVEDRRTDPSGNIVTRRYVRGKLLGKGGFAKCFLFTSAETGKVLAGKCVSKESLAKHKAKQKVRVLAGWSGAVGYIAVGGQPTCWWSRDARDNTNAGEARQLRAWQVVSMCVAWCLAPGCCRGSVIRVLFTGTVPDS